MSFEIARMIVQSYRQSNEERIKSSMEMAYREALQTYKSEEAARDAALDVLKSDQKLLDTMLKNIEKSRQRMITGDMKTAKENLAREFRNEKRQRSYEHKLKIEEIKRQEAIGQQQYRQATADLQVAQTQALVDEDMDENVGKARNWAKEIVLSDDLATNTLGGAISSLSEIIQKGGETNEIADVLKRELLPSMNRYIGEARRTEDGIGKGLENKGATSAELMPFRKADTAHYIMQQLEKNAPTSGAAAKKAPELIELVRQYIHGDLPDNSALGIEATQGKLKEGSAILPSQVETKFEEQAERKYRQLSGGKSPKQKIRRPIAPGRLDRPVMPPLMEKMLPTRDASIGRELRQAAQPVFEALRNDFEITAEEQEKISPEAINAYNKLKEVVIDNPLAVTREEQTLLDDLALQRQYDILQQKRRISTMSPQLASTERIKARAGELAEPEQKFDASQFSPAQQKYFATERKAYELSDKSDNDIRNIGVPEKFGLSLFNETFDKGRKSYVEGQSYDSVLSRLETQFEGKPEEQLRALAAYNSRAMALQRASNPLIVDGQKNPDYLEALKALGK